MDECGGEEGGKVARGNLFELSTSNSLLKMVQRFFKSVLLYRKRVYFIIPEIVIQVVQLFIEIIKH